MRQLNQFVSGKICAAALVVSGVVLGGLVAGCQPAPAPAPYPTNPAPMTPPPAPAMDMIPVGAVPLSEGPYNQIAFKLPSDQSGMIYIVDKDLQKVVGKTNVGTPGESMTMADLKNVTQALDNTHSFKIWFVPTMATTKPVAP
jgi:hypothetical protein